MNVDFPYLPMCIAVYFHPSVHDYSLIPPPHTYDWETAVVVVAVVVDVVVSAIVVVVLAVVTPIVVVVLTTVVVFAAITFVVVATLAAVGFVVVASVAVAGAVLAAELVQRTCLHLLAYMCPDSAYSASLEIHPLLLYH